MTHRVIGWDVGGVNTKVARVAGGVVCQIHSVPYEIQRAPAELGPLIARLAQEIAAEPGDHHAVTMTAELSQYFRSKREGVGFVLDAFDSALPASTIQVYGTDGIFRDLERARRDPLPSAASNWVATAAVVAWTWRDAVLMDVGTTTTDIIPVADGAVVARGRTDPARLRTGELLYLGTIRTPVEAIVHEVPLGGVHRDALGVGSEGNEDAKRGESSENGERDDTGAAEEVYGPGMAGVSAESFALAGDVHLWLGEIGEEDYTVPTPDGRPATRDGARDRLARVVCADGEMLDDSAITAIARHVAGVQVERMARSLERVLTHHPSIPIVVTAGLGSFLARRAAERVGIASVELGEVLGAAAARSAPAAAVALLLEQITS